MKKKGQDMRPIALVAGMVLVVVILVISVWSYAIKPESWRRTFADRQHVKTRIEACKAEGLRLTTYEDTDKDKLPNFCDPCPNTPDFKTTDTDGDGFVDGCKGKDAKGKVFIECTTKSISDRDNICYRRKPYGEDLTKKPEYNYLKKKT